MCKAGFVLFMDQMGVRFRSRTTGMVRGVGDACADSLTRAHVGGTKPLHDSARQPGTFHVRSSHISLSQYLQSPVFVPLCESSDSDNGAAVWKSAYLSDTNG